jgi:hypothetical protein
MKTASRSVALLCTRQWSTTTATATASSGPEGNDEINQRRSKGLHELNTRRIIAERRRIQGRREARREAAAADGMVIATRARGRVRRLREDERLEGQINLALLTEAKAEIENFGPNPALLGKGGVENSSGRAINLLQQAGMAELGPFILAFRGWKIRVYRAIWNAVVTHWTAERWIRVTDDDGGGAVRRHQSARAAPADRAAAHQRRSGSSTSTSSSTRARTRST